MIERKEYLEKLKKWKDKDLIKVITGIRRCGKSTLFELYINYLKSIGIDDNHIISINLENPDNEFASYKELYQYVKEQIKDNGQYYVFLDEIQNLVEFQKAVDGLYIKKNVDIYITGSNAYLLSGELATLFHPVEEEKQYVLTLFRHSGAMLYSGTAWTLHPTPPMFL